MPKTDVYQINAMLSALESVRGDVKPTCAEVLLACTEMIRQTLEEIPDPQIRVWLIAGVTEALRRDDTTVLAAVWGERTNGEPTCS